MKIACFVEAYNFDLKSERSALSKFKSTAESMGHSFEFIYKDDISKYQIMMLSLSALLLIPAALPYIVSRLAEQSGLKVIDDPHSIRTCSNKVILHDIFQKK